jgi:hypothetical protein
MGVKPARKNMPISVPSTEPVVAMPMARPAMPWRASAYPSRQDAADAGVPGMFSKMAERDPP